MSKTLQIGWTTIGSEAAAKSLAQGMVEQGLAACVQVDGAIESIYHWEGAVQCEREWRLMVKFAAEKGDKLLEYIEMNHPYEVPEWVVVHADQVAPDYLQWALGSEEQDRS